MKNQITVIIGQDGKVTFGVEGASGSKCLALTEPFENEIGDVLERQKNSDYYRETQIRIRNRQSIDKGAA